MKEIMFILIGQAGDEEKFLKRRRCRDKYFMIISGFNYFDK
jgi:hypothetical protein